MRPAGPLLARLMTLLLFRSMPCAAGSRCQHGPNILAPLKSSGSHACRSDCGGRLHGTCGRREAFSDNEIHRLCPTCFEQSGHDGPLSDGKDNDFDGDHF